MKYYSSIFQILLITVLTYPLFYFSYKYGSPELALTDFYSYYRLYENWDVGSVESPFNLRLLSPALVHLFYKLGFYYDTDIIFNNPDFKQEVFFNSILVSYLSIIMTCFVISKTVMRQTGKTWFSLVMGMGYLLGFGTMFFGFSGLTDAFSILMIALIWYTHQQKSMWIFPLLALSIFQRELIFFIFITIAAVYIYFKEDRNYNWKVIAGAAFFFMVYFVLRKTIFYTEQYANQVTISGFADGITNFRMNFTAFRQIFLTQNILIFYLLVLLYKRLNKLYVRSRNLVFVGALVAMIMALIILVKLGYNGGRYLYMIVPMVISYLAMELDLLHQGKKE